MKFKVGDKVRLVDVRGEALSEYIKYLGRKGEITSISRSCTGKDYANVKFEDGTTLAPYISGLKLIVDHFTKSDLKERMIVKFRNGIEAMLDEDDAFREIEEGKFTDYYTTDLDGIKEDLTDINGRTEHDIVKVYKPKYETVFAREEEEIREVTIEEIEEKFGCKVKIIREDK